MRRKVLVISNPELTQEDALDSVLLNMDVRNQLRLGSNFETFRHTKGRWFVKPLTKKTRLWIATRGPDGFSFEEIDLRQEEHEGKPSSE